MVRIQLERKEHLSREEFVREHLAGNGKPIIVTDALENWLARSKWTFDYFKTVYGADMVTAPLSLFGREAKLTNLASYIDYLNSPGDDLPGLWIDTKSGRPVKPAHESNHLPHYLLGWKAFEKHPELHADIKPSPYFVDDWVLALDPTLQQVFESACEKELWSIYIGPKGTLSQLHQDFWYTHSYLAQIQGTKRVMLFAPSDSEFLYHGKVDPANPDLERFPLFERTTIYEGVIGPGDILFTPGKWWHWVVGLENSITVSHNFFNDINFAEHMKWMLVNLPTLVKEFKNHPEWREKLGIDWDTKDFA